MEDFFALILATSIVFILFSFAIYFIGIESKSRIRCPKCGGGWKKIKKSPFSSLGICKKCKHVFRESIFIINNVCLTIQTVLFFIPILVFFVYSTNTALIIGSLIVLEAALLVGLSIAANKLAYIADKPTCSSCNTKMKPTHYYYKCEKCGTKIRRNRYKI